MKERISIQLVEKNMEIKGFLELWEMEEKVRIDLVFSNYIITKCAENFFDALVKVRKELDKIGVKMLCKGCCKKVYPSEMILNMGVGRHAYMLEFGRKASMDHLVDIFSSCETSEFATVKEQYEYFKQWIKSLEVQ